MKKVLLLIIVIFSVVGCSKVSTFTIEATTDHPENKKVYLIAIGTYNTPVWPYFAYLSLVTACQNCITPEFSNTFFSTFSRNSFAPKFSDAPTRRRVDVATYLTTVGVPLR